MRSGVVAVVAVLASLGSPVLVWWIFKVLSRAATRRAMTKPPEHIADPGRVSGALFGAVVLGAVIQVLVVVLAPAKDAPPTYALVAAIGSLGLVSAWLMHSLPGHRRNLKYGLFIVSTSTVGIAVSLLSASRPGGDAARLVAVSVGGGLLFNLVVAALCVAVFRPDAPLVAGDPSSLRALDWYRRLTWFQGSDVASGVVMGALNFVGLGTAYLLMRWCVKARVGRHSIVYLRSFHYQDAGQVFGGLVTPALFRMAPSTGLVHLAQSSEVLDRDVPLLWRSSFATINDANWQPWVERHLQHALGVVLDVSVMSQSVEWEVATVRQQLPPERIIVLHRSDVAPPVLPGLTVLSYDATSKDTLAQARLGLAQWAAGALTSAVGKVPAPTKVDPPRYQLPVLLLVWLMFGLPVGVATGVGIGVVGQLKDARVAMAKNELTNLSSALDLHYVTKIKYPEVLEQLVDARVVQRVPKDPWGRDYVYRPPGEADRSFELLSLGPDGVEGTEDDVRLERKKRAP